MFFNSINSFIFVFGIFKEKGAYSNFGYQQSLINNIVQETKKSPLLNVTK